MSAAGKRAIGYYLRQPGRGRPPCRDLPRLADPRRRPLLLVLAIQYHRLRHHVADLDQVVARLRAELDRIEVESGVEHGEEVAA